MSCYLRHVKDEKGCLMCLLEEAGIEVNPGNRKQIDQAVHKVVGMDYKDCSGTWRKIKNEILVDDKKRRDFVSKLSAAIK